MYAVIKTGGKQYRVQAGDMLIVEKLDGAPGASLAFDKVLMIGEGSEVTVGAPLVEGASVSATLVETRKGEKIKVFKKIRRQGYRRTRGHRQFQSVLRVTAIAGAGREATWDGAIDLTPLSVLNARARDLARGMDAAAARTAERSAGNVAPRKVSEPDSAAKSEQIAAPAKVVAGKTKAAAKKAPRPKAAPEDRAPEAAAKKASGKKTAAKKTAARSSEKS